jgi:hypothetical protein
MRVVDRALIHTASTPLTHTVEQALIHTVERALIHTVDRLSFTPGFSPVLARHTAGNRFNGFQTLGFNISETVKTVPPHRTVLVTGLKPGVNERSLHGVNERSRSGVNERSPSSN